MSVKLLDEELKKLLENQKPRQDIFLPRRCPACGTLLTTDVDEYGRVNYFCPVCPASQQELR